MSSACRGPHLLVWTDLVTGAGMSTNSHTPPTYTLPYARKTTKTTATKGRCSRESLWTTALVRVLLGLLTSTPSYDERRCCRL